MTNESSTGEPKPKTPCEIFAKSHRGERNRRGETDRGRNESSHETERRVINLREKMIFASGARQRGAQFAVAKRAAKRRDPADDPEHQQRESGLNVRQLKTEAREDAGADDVGNHDGARRHETDRPPRGWRFHGTRGSRDRSVIGWIDSSHSSACLANETRGYRGSAALQLVPGLKMITESRAPNFDELSEAIPGITLKVRMNPHPKLSIESATQLAVFLANRPGALARVCEALAKAEINIHALATSDTVDHSVVRHGGEAIRPRRSCFWAKPACSRSRPDVLMIETAERTGRARKIAERLAEAEVNIEYAYLGERSQ